MRAHPSSPALSHIVVVDNSLNEKVLLGLRLAVEAFENLLGKI